MNILEILLGVFHNPSLANCLRNSLLSILSENDRDAFNSNPTDTTIVNKRNERSIPNEPYPFETRRYPLANFKTIAMASNTRTLRASDNPKSANFAMKPTAPNKTDATEIQTNSCPHG